MPIQAVILDFDGTIISEDFADVLCDLVGKKMESEELNRQFQQGKVGGLESLMERTNFLCGISLDQIRELVSQNDYLRIGARELFAFLKKHEILSIIISGNLLPLLEIYQKKLGADYILGTKPTIENGKIISFAQQDYMWRDLKPMAAKEILDQHGIPFSSTLTIGDSPGDKGIFQACGKSIAINPQGDIANFADYVIHDDLSLAVPIIEELMRE